MQWVFQATESYPICTWAGSHYEQDWKEQQNKNEIKSNRTGYLLLEVKVNRVQVE